MFKIYFDTEFLEGTQTRRILGIPFGKTKPTIDLISIGMIRDDGQEYYAVSKDFNLWEAWNRYDIKTEEVSGDMRNVFPEGKKTKVYWIRENVLRPIFNELCDKHWLKSPFLAYSDFSYKNMEILLKIYGKSNEQIKKEIHYFCINEFIVNNKDQRPVELYGYYSAYDHCALCWLFGKMIDLPSGFPMYTKDLKQILDHKANFIANKVCYESGNHTVWSIKEAIDFIKKDPAYPKQQNEHSAIHDARWNKQLHEFLKHI